MFFVSELSILFHVYVGFSKNFRPGSNSRSDMTSVFFEQTCLNVYFVTSIVSIPPSHVLIVTYLTDVSLLFLCRFYFALLRNNCWRNVENSIYQSTCDKFSHVGLFLQRWKHKLQEQSINT